VSDYLFRRPKATNTAPWLPVSQTGVPPTTEVISEEQLMPFRRLEPIRPGAAALRAVVTAYVVLAVTVPPPEPGMVAEEQITRRIEPIRPRASPRAAASAYEVLSTTVPPADVAPAEEVLFEARRLMPERVPPQARAGAAAYLITPLFIIPAEPPLAQFLPGHVPPRARAAPQVYWFENREVVADVAPAEEPLFQPRRLLPERALPRARAALDAYRITTSFVVAEVPTVDIGVVMPDRAPGPRRAGDRAYAVLVQGFDEELSGDQARGYLDLMPRPARRAATHTYWQNNWLVVPPPPEVAPFAASMPERARAASATAHHAYWLDNLLAVPEVVPEAPPLELRKVLMPERALRATRAATKAYDVGGGSTEIFAAVTIIPGPYCIAAGEVYVAGPVVASTGAVAGQIACN
jgi:hypothetical protein